MNASHRPDDDSAMRHVLDGRPGNRGPVLIPLEGQPPGSPSRRNGLATVVDRPIRVVVCDRLEVTRAGLCTILSQSKDIEVVASVGDGAEVLTAARALRPDVLLVDVNLPTLDGIEVTRRLSGDPGGRSSNVIILASEDDHRRVVHALEAGARGFLLKSVPGSMVADAVRSVAAGDAVLAPSVTSRLIDLLVTFPLQALLWAPPAPPSPPDKVAATRFESLTDRQQAVLRMVAKGMSNAEIAAALCVTEATVKTHVSSLLRRLELRDRTQLVVFAYRSGFLVGV